MLKESYRKYIVTFGTGIHRSFLCLRSGGVHLSLKVLLSSNDVSQDKELHVREHYKQKRID
jgi:hypothetical protein